MVDETIRRIRSNDPSLKSAKFTGRIQLNQFFDALSENCSLHYLRIYRSDIDVAVATSLSLALVKLPELKCFCLWDCECSNTEAVMTLSSALASKNSLRTLAFHDCPFAQQGIDPFFAAFVGNTTLHALHFDLCRAGTRGATALASLLATNSSLHTVSFKDSDLHAGGGPGIGFEGVSALARALATNQTLKTLHISKVGPYEYERALACFQKAIYNDDSMKAIISNSNHTLSAFLVDGADWSSFVPVNGEGAVQSKIVRFLDEQPLSVISVCLEKSVLPTVFDKVGRKCRLNTMFELLRNVPDLFEGPVQTRKDLGHNS